MQENYGSDELGDMNYIAPMVKMLWQLPTRRNMVFELKYAYEDNNYNQSYAGQTTADFNVTLINSMLVISLVNIIQNTTRHMLNLSDINSNITNTTTGYFNYFTRDWFKLDKVISGGTMKLETVVSKAATGNCLAGLGILKGSTAGQLRA